MGISVEIHRVVLLFHCFQIESEIRNVVFCAGRKTDTAKNPRSKDENQQQTQPTYVRDSNPGHIGGRRGECCHHCVIPAPISNPAPPTYSATSPLACSSC